MILYCKKCGGEKHVKAGFISGEQRYLCKDCGCKFVPTRQKGKPKEMKLMAVWLYCHGLSMRTIAKFLKVNVRSVFNWIKAFAEENYVKPEPKSESVVIELDEMWHYLHSKKDKFGFGRPIVEIPASSSTGNAEEEILIHSPSSTNG